MDCRSFRRNHLAYLDDTLPGVEMAEMQDHLRECAGCARHDAAVRRSLLLLRNIPAIQPSSDFNERLQRRLSLEAARVRRGDIAFRGPSLAVFAGAAASVVTLGAIALMLVGAEPAQSMDLPRLPAVVAYPATEPAAPSENISVPAFVASMSTGMPVWPALLLADEGSVRFANAEFEGTSWSSARPQH